MGTSNTQSISQQYHAGLNTLTDTVINAIVEVCRYQGNQVSVSKTGNPQMIIKKDLVNARFTALGIQAHITNDLYVQGETKVLENLQKFCEVF